MDPQPQWEPGDVVLAADGSLWCRAAEHDIEQGWPWAYCHGSAPRGGVAMPEGSVAEDYPVRPLRLLLRDGQPVVTGPFDADQPWPIPLPHQDDALLDRVLEACDVEGTVRARWRYGGSQMAEGWKCVEGAKPNPDAPIVGVVSGFYDLFEEIVAGCIKYGWTLWSMPTIGGANAPDTPRGHGAR
jgi:hypothetical protein